MHISANTPSTVQKIVRSSMARISPGTHMGNIKLVTLIKKLCITQYYFFLKKYFFYPN